MPAPRTPEKAIQLVLVFAIGCASTASPKPSPKPNGSTRTKQISPPPSTPAPSAASGERLEPAELVVQCCTVACFPGGVLGHACNLDTLRQRILDKAATRQLQVGKISCQETTLPCNVTCESPPGVRLSCDAPIRATPER